MFLMRDLWYLAIIPDEEVIEKVDHHRLYAAAHFNSRHALKSPPHITLFPPFRLSEAQINQVTGVIEKYGQKHNQFEVKLQDFDFFPPRVVYLAVEENEDLIKLQKGLNQLLREDLKIEADRPDHNFNPHLTIAHRDLNKENFYRALEYFTNQTFEEFFKVEDMVLLRHDGKRWHQWHRFLLGISEK